MVCLDKDHPHACGDKRNSLLRHRSNPGSSPRVWGQVFLQLPMILKPHIIPTRVGTSHRCRGRQCRTQDHPHACGDKLTQYLAVSQIAGSSPRVWGQVAQVLNASWNKRIIPTRVGTSEGREPEPSSKEDHPHACGDKLPFYLLNSVAEGSSPRVWGQESLTSF